MKKIGITGQSGFIGWHLYHTLGLFPEDFDRIEFKREYFDDQDYLDQFVKSCDVIVHLAAINRHQSERFLYETNIGLAQKLADSLIRTASKAHIMVASSVQEDNDNVYGKSKKIGREILSNWAEEKDTVFTGLIIPNVFGAFGKPYYNSFIATFCYQLIHGETPKIVSDNKVELIYIQELISIVISEIRTGNSRPKLSIAPTAKKKVSEVLALLENYHVKYFDSGEIPLINNSFEHNLFNTYRSYINYTKHYPVEFIQNIDPRGVFVEVIRLGNGGQCSFSTTVPGITRGNHFHTRKIERFAVIKGKARVQLRKIDSDEVLDFHLDGKNPAYVDMPIWYTHNIKNIGEDELYTIFWINEAYNPKDSDTYYLDVDI